MVFEAYQATNPAFKHPCELHYLVKSIRLSWVCVKTVKTDNINVTNIDFSCTIWNLVSDICCKMSLLWGHSVSFSSHANQPQTSLSVLPAMTHWSLEVCENPELRFQNVNLLGSWKCYILHCIGQNGQLYNQKLFDSRVNFFFPLAFSSLSMCHWQLGNTLQKWYCDFNQIFVYVKHFPLS